MSNFNERAAQSTSRIVQARSVLVGLNTDGLVVDYLNKAQKWNPSHELFPQRGRLENILITETSRLYGPEVAGILKVGFNNTWAVETGAHLHLPKSYDRRTDQGPSFNPLVFQGQIWWTVTTRNAGRSLNLSLNSGRVPLNNINSGSHLQYSIKEEIEPIRLVPDKPYRETPQTLIPAITPENIAHKVEQITTLRDQRKITEEEFQLAMEILNNIKERSDCFSDQIVTGHALIMNKVVSNLGIEQLTMDSEIVGINYLIELFSDFNSLYSRIFSDTNLLNKFLHHFSGIYTGWTEDEGPFYEITYQDNKDQKGARISNYPGNLMPDTLVDGLKKKRLIPRGITKFLAFMMEGGLCPIGGMNQAGYCTEIKDCYFYYFSLLGNACTRSEAKIVGWNYVCTSTPQ